MKKYFFITIILLTLMCKGFAQSIASEKEKPCYTKQWVDSINTASPNSANAIVPVMVEWYSYEGQAQKHSLPPNIVNVIFVKLEENVCEDTK